MPDNIGILTIRLDSDEAAAICRALSSEQRLRLLSSLQRQVMTVNEVAAALGMAQPKASMHIRALEEAGLIESAIVSTSKGSEKRCWAKYEEVRFQVSSDASTPDQDEPFFVEEVSMPVGAFTSISVESPCGLADESAIINPFNRPEALMGAQRFPAQLLWFARGWVEYTFPCIVPPDAEIVEIDFAAEMCSEAIGYDNNWPSDISLWVNGTSIGCWSCPGDFGGRRGRLNPDWWQDRDTQHGMLKTWSVDFFDCRLDGAGGAPPTIGELGLEPGKPVLVRIGVDPDAPNQGGVNIFGKRFGDFPQDLTLRFRYKLPKSS